MRARPAVPSGSGAGFGARHGCFLIRRHHEKTLLAQPSTSPESYLTSMPPPGSGCSEVCRLPSGFSAR